MAEMTDELRALWQSRQDRPWFVNQYEAALARIEDHTDDDANPYFEAPADGTCAIPGCEALGDAMGSEIPIEEARSIAFQLLALADLAETTPARSEPTHGD